MKEFKYPEIDKHREEHKMLCDNILLEVSELMVHPNNIGHLHQYLIKWLLEHILESDLKLSTHLKNLY